MILFHCLKPDTKILLPDGSGSGERMLPNGSSCERPEVAMTAESSRTAVGTEIAQKRRLKTIETFGGEPAGGFFTG